MFSLKMVYLSQTIPSQVSNRFEKRISIYNSFQFQEAKLAYKLLSKRFGIKDVREACNKKNSKMSEFINKGGWGQNFMKTNFFFTIATLGRTLYETISLP